MGDPRVWVFFYARRGHPRILRPARELGFPAWYVRRIEDARLCDN
jgi:hypothetical protein